MVEQPASTRAVSAESQALRPDPIDLLIHQEQERIPWLLPLRHSRMAESAFAFFRGAALLMASDLSRHPHSGLTVQLCGDAHLMNFGFYGSPERHLLFDINDFDETYPGPFEWDLVRLATSMLLAARSLGLSEKKQIAICQRCVRSYGRAMAVFADMPFIPMYVTDLDLERLIQDKASSSLQLHLVEAIAAAKRRHSRSAVRKLCVSGNDGQLFFRQDPPLIWRYAELPERWGGGANWADLFEPMLERYLSSVRPEVRRVLSQFRLSDAAIKVVGVGSIGTRCSIGVFVGRHREDVLVIQSKQAVPSVLSPYLPADPSDHEGERVVQGQRLLQTHSDSLLGWTTTPQGHHLYWRHFRDWKGSVNLAGLDSDGLRDYGRLCAWTLAKGHARSGDRVAISNHIREPRVFAERLLGQALVHAHQAEEDHQALLQAIRDGRLEIRMTGPSES